MINVNGTQQPLILASMTTIGTSSFRERVEVAAAAGFDALGLSLAAFREISAGEMSPKEMKSVLDANGMRVAELEAVFGYAIEPAKTGIPFGGGLVYTPPEDLKDFWTMAELFEPHHLQAVGAFDTDVLEPDAIERFAGLCDQAATVGIKIGLEFLPTTNIPDAGVALSIVEQADRPNGGLCIDSWHHTRGAQNLDLLRAVPPHRVSVIQLDDGPAEPADPNFLYETMHYRDVPGDGDFDLAGFFAAIFESGTSAPVSVEVLSDSLSELTPQDGALRLVKGTQSVLPV